MIFPDLPKHYQWQHSAPELIQNRDPVLEHVQANVGPCTAKAPLRGPRGITAEEWLVERGYSVGPAAGSRERAEKESINWFAQDALEFYALCAGMLCWIVYWYGVHVGLW